MSFAPTGGQSFFDFINQNAGLLQSAAPLLTGLLVKKPSMDYNAIAPLYADIAANAQRANAYADQQAQFRNENFNPRALAFGREADAVDSPDRMANAEGRVAGRAQQQFAASRDALNRRIDMNPTQRAAALGQLRSRADLNALTGMDAARTGLMQQGRNARAQALRNFDTEPNYALGAGISGQAASGLNALRTGALNDYRQEVRDTTAALDFPWQQADKRKREESAAADRKKHDEIVAAVLKNSGYGEIKGTT